MSPLRSASVLIELLRKSLGPQVAQERVTTAVRQLTLNPAALSEHDALRVLELLAGEKGIVGVSARFVKARLVLVWAQS